MPSAKSDILSARAVKSALVSAEISGPPSAEIVAGRFVFVIEPTANGFSAYAPDLLGCVATGRSVEEVDASMREAIAGLVEDLRNAGSLVPVPSASIRYVDVAV